MGTHIVVVWVMTTCSPVVQAQFTGTCCLQLLTCLEDNNREC